MKIKIASFDPALSNLGIARMSFDVLTGKLTLESLRLVQTTGSKIKTVRKNSDDLERARSLLSGLRIGCLDCHFAIAEIPVGTQSARGAMSNGIALGILAACPLPLIQVSPKEAKMASVGIATATKPEMIEWAMKKYPHADWLMHKRGGKLVPLNDNEHLADACAIAEAGILSDQFTQAIAAMRAFASSPK